MLSRKLAGVPPAGADDEPGGKMEDPSGLPLEARTGRHGLRDALEERVGDGGDGGEETPVFEDPPAHPSNDEAVISERSSELELSSLLPEAPPPEATANGAVPSVRAAAGAILRDPARRLPPHAERKGERKGELVRSLPALRSETEQADRKPSFWRRLALGRKAEPEPELPQARPATPVDLQIVEPLLQAMVSIEAKLERSHDELAVRLDSVDERLTQLWEIEEQLGALGELHESLGRVADQQQRIEATQSLIQRSIRNLALILIVLFGAGAFALAALLR